VSLSEIKYIVLILTMRNPYKSVAAILSGHVAMGKESGTLALSKKAGNRQRCTSDNMSMFGYRPAVSRVNLTSKGFIETKVIYN
jgi:hypothetical protein